MLVVGLVMMMRGRNSSALFSLTDAKQWPLVVVDALVSALSFFSRASISARACHIAIPSSSRVMPLALPALLDATFEVLIAILPWPLASVPLAYICRIRVAG